MSFLSLGAGYLPPSKIIFYTSYVNSGDPQHLEVTMDTETGRKYITLLNTNPGVCPLAYRRIGGNRCMQNHCNLCDRSPRVVNNPVSLHAESNDVDPSAPKPAYTNTSNAASSHSKLQLRLPRLILLHHLLFPVLKMDLNQHSNILLCLPLRRLINTQPSRKSLLTPITNTGKLNTLKKPPRGSCIR